MIGKNVDNPEYLPVVQWEAFFECDHCKVRL